jgi:ketosteroid isomerase-like protein
MAQRLIKFIFVVRLDPGSKFPSAFEGLNLAATIQISLLTTSYNKTMDIQLAIEEYYKAIDIFSRGNPEPVKNLYAHSDDVMLANPFGSMVIGWKSVSEALDVASSAFRDGEVKSIERIATYKSNDLLVIFELEKWMARVGGNSEPSLFDLRVTSTFRNENGNWKLVHRHADPIASFNDKGPIRGDL